MKHGAFKYDPQTKRQNVTLLEPKKVCFKKFKIKTMFIRFYESEHIIHKVFVAQGHRIIDDYYLSVMECLWKIIV